jgi:nicotinate phosphoribosyltransferase
VFGKGVTVESIFRLRKQLDEYGGKHVKIIASSGFGSEKTHLFEAMEAPVDVYGVGLGEIKNYFFATSDIVEVDGKRFHKTGRYEDSFDENGKYIPEK